MARKNPTIISDKIGVSAEKAKVNTVLITCPYCDAATNQKVKYSLTGSVPNLLDCPDCRYHFLAIQSTEIKIKIIEIQDQIEKSESGTKTTKREAEGATSTY